MKQIEEEIYELNKTEYEKTKVRATFSQNNNSPDAIRSYHIIERKDRTDLLEYTLSLYQGSKASYCLYKNVFPGYIESISGIPFSDFNKMED